MRRAFLVSVCVLVGGVWPALAQERIREARKESKGGDVRKVSALMGSKVSVRDGDALGEVEDLVINDNGGIDFLIVRNEDDYVAVPWSVTTFNALRRSVMVNNSISRAKLRDVTFTRNNWPNFYGDTFGRNLQNVWGEQALRRGPGAGPAATGGGRRGGRPEEPRPNTRRPRDREPGPAPTPPPNNRPPNPPPAPPPAR